MDMKSSNLPLQGHEYMLAKVLTKCPILVLKWKELAYALEVQEDLHTYEKDESCKLRLLNMLTQFISQNGVNATFEKLVAVLQEEDFVSAADSVQLYLETQVSSESPSKKPRTRLNSSFNSTPTHNLANQELPHICSQHTFQCDKCQWSFNIQRASSENHTPQISCSDERDDFIQRKNQKIRNKTSS